MKKIVIFVVMLSCLILSSCKEKTQQSTLQSPQQAASVNTSMTASSNKISSEKTTLHQGLGITTKHYQTAYNAQVQQFNQQMKQDPIRMTALNLKITGKQFKACSLPYACLKGVLTEDSQYISQIAIIGTLTMKTPKSLMLAPVHMIIGTVSAIPDATIPEIKTLLDKLSHDAQKRHSLTASTQYKGYNLQFFHPKQEQIILTITKPLTK